MTIRRPVTIVALLSGLNLLNYLDRYVLAAVGPAISRDLGLDDLGFGLLSNAFMVGYFVTSPLFGALGDRRSRKGLIAGGVAGFCLATMASGAARTLAGLMIARALVGIGEASYATIAPTLVDDLAPPEQKNRWLSVFYVAIPVGSALGYLLGGQVERAWGWHAAFFVAGAPGLALALLMLLVREPPRAAPRARASHEPRAWVTLARLPAYRDAVVGYVAYTFALGGFAVWAPHYLYRRMGLELAAADTWFGAIVVVAGIAGTFVGAAIGDRWPGADRVRANLRVCAVTAALAAPFAFAALLAGSPVVFFAMLGVAELLLFASTSPINVVLLAAVPAELRATAMAASIFAIHLFGDLVSPPLVGYLSDRSSLGAAMLVLPAAIVVCAVAWWRGSREHVAAPA